MELSVVEIKERIYVVRGFRIDLDKDLAEFYQSKTKILNQTVKRNLDRFPADFRFQLTKAEWETLPVRGKGSNSKRRTLPYAFTPGGISMLAGVLNSKRAAQVNILLIRTFSQLQKVASNNFDIVGRLDSLEQNSREQFKTLTEMIQNAKTQNSFSNISHKENRIPVEVGFYSKVEKIQQAVAQFFGIRIQDLKNTKKFKAIVIPRQIAIYLVRTQLGLSFKEIGAYFGNKDHTTILHSYRKIQMEVKNGGKIQEIIKSIEYLIQD